MSSIGTTCAWLAHTDDGLFADPVQPVAEADRRGRLAFAGWRRVDRRHQDQLAVLTARQRSNEVGADLCLVVPIGCQRPEGNVELGADLADRLLLRRAGNFDIGFHAGHGVPSDKCDPSECRRHR
jgi:hypothetical protein